MRVVTILLFLASLVLGAAVTQGGLAVFTDQATVGGNTFTTAASFGGSAMRLATGTYTGDGVDNRQITGAGFQPDVVFIKCDCSQFPVARTSTMAGDATKVVGDTGGLQANHVQTLDADGFMTGNSANVNGAGNTYYWAAFRAGDELKLGTYVGDGTDNRSVTGVGFQPVWVGALGDGSDSVFRPATAAGDASYRFRSGGKLANRIQALEVDGFQIGTHLEVNSTGVTYHYIAWKASANVTQSSYIGDETDNRSITGVGFQPEMVWVKNDQGNPSVWRPQSLSGDASFRWNATAAVLNRIQALEADGFQVGSHAQVNIDGETIHYIAFRDGGP